MSGTLSAGTVSIGVKSNTKGFGRGLSHALMGEVGGIGKLMGGVVMAGFGLAVSGISAVIGVGMKEAMDAQKLNAQFTAGIKSTGNAAGLSVKSMDDLAASIAGYSGQSYESIGKTEQLLQTFRDIKNEGPNKIFDQATVAAADMAAKMGGDASGMAIKLGRALNDPVKGVMALTRVGVQFTQGQKDSIKAMVAHGDTVGAQKIILGELTKEFGGAAKAAGETLPGQLARGKVAFGELSKTVMEGVLPSLTSAMGGVNDFITGTQASFRKGGISQVFTDISAKIMAALPGIKMQLGKWGVALWAWVQEAVPPMLVKLGELVVKFETWAFTVAYPAIAAKLVEWGKAFVAWIGPMIPPLMAKLGELLTQLGTWIYTVALPAVVAQLKTWAEAFVAWITPILPPMLAKLGQMLGGVGTWILNVGLPLLVTKLVEWAGAFVKWVVPLIGPLLLELGKLLLKLAGWILTVALPAIVSKLGEWAGAFFKWIPGATVSMLKALIPLLGQLGTWIVSTAAPQLVTKMMEWSKAFASWIARAIIEAPGKLLGLLGTVITWAKSVGPKILSTLGDLSGLLRDAGMSVVRGLISGIGSMAGDVGHALLMLLPGPLQQFAAKLGIKSPSTVFAGFGANIGQGLINGIDGTQSDVAASMRGLVSLPRVGSLDFATSSVRSAAVAGSVVGGAGFDYDRMAAAMSRAQIILDGKNVARSVDQRLAPR